MRRCTVDTSSKPSSATTLDMGRPDRVHLLFPTRMTRRTPAPRRGYHTRVITTGVAPNVHISYKHTDIKQYFKEQAGLRTEVTFNDVRDFLASISFFGPD